MAYTGIAIGGNKFAGKDLILDHLLVTRENPVVVRCKTPIVEAYERIVGHAYNKGRDDAELIHVSATQIRGGPNGNDNICGDYLRDTIPPLLERGALPLIPDMRRKPENEACYDLGLLCIKIEACEEVRKARGIARDGSLQNWVPNDATELDVDEQRYHYVIDNNRGDGGKFAISQLEEILRRSGARFARKPQSINVLDRVRVVDHHDPHFWKQGEVRSVGFETNRPIHACVSLDDDDYDLRYFFFDQLMKTAA